MRPGTFWMSLAVLLWLLAVAALLGPYVSAWSGEASLGSVDMSGSVRYTILFAIGGYLCFRKARQES